MPGRTRTKLSSNCNQSVLSWQWAFRCQEVYLGVHHNSLKVVLQQFPCSQLGTNAYNDVPISMPPYCIWVADLLGPAFDEVWVVLLRIELQPFVTLLVITILVSHACLILSSLIIHSYTTDSNTRLSFCTQVARCLHKGDSATCFLSKWDRPGRRPTHTCRRRFASSSPTTLLGCGTVTTLAVSARPHTNSHGLRYAYGQFTSVVTMKNTLENPGSSNFWTSLCPGEIHPLRLMAGSGQTLISPDAYFANWAYMCILDVADCVQLFPSWNRLFMA